MIPRETVLLPTLWTEESVGGVDGRKALEWLEGTEAEKQLQRKDGEGLSLVRLLVQLKMILMTGRDTSIPLYP